MAQIRGWEKMRDDLVHNKDIPISEPGVCFLYHRNHGDDELYKIGGNVMNGLVLIYRRLVGSLWVDASGFSCYVGRCHHS